MIATTLWLLDPIKTGLSLHKDSQPMNDDTCFDKAILDIVSCRELFPSEQQFIVIPNSPWLWI
jgi:hypothetical protein